MRERRWETTEILTFEQVLAVGERLRQLGLKPAVPTHDVIGYVEEWTVQAPDAIDQLNRWPIEDVTMVHIRERWRGDFFLLAASYHEIYRRHRDVGTYCSVSHPWRIREPLRLHDSRGMFWLGFRHLHSFVRVRVETREVITPGETRGDAERERWLDERRAAFLEAITTLEVPVETAVDRNEVVLSPRDASVPFFCSWPDAFGPCQFEYNSTDVYEFLVPASKLAETVAPAPVEVRASLTGFSSRALAEFQAIDDHIRLAYRCSVHCPVDELPEVLQIIEPDGRLYATLCEFPTQVLVPTGGEASAIIGIVGAQGRFQIEARLNRAPLKEDVMADWLQWLVGYPMVYAPLPAFM